MTDLEMTQLCAEAMGIHVISSTNGLGDGGFFYQSLADTMPNGGICALAKYDPLRNDAEAMALVKEFRIDISACDPSGWVTCIDSGAVWGDAKDLNRAIVECVAKMQAAKVEKAAD